MDDIDEMFEMIAEDELHPVRMNSRGIIILYHFVLLSLMMITNNYFTNNSG